MKVSCTYPDCRKQFASAHNLRRHVVTFHLGQRRHECSVCLDRFSSKQNLTIHMYRHRREVIALPPNVQPVGQVESIPLLTTLVEKTTDPDLRPYTKVLRLYIYPIALKLSIIPKIDKESWRREVKPLPHPSANKL